MLKFIKENPFKTITGIISIITALSAAGYSVYTTSSEYFEQFATRAYVKEQITDLSLEVLNVSIMRYEDELQSIDFLIQLGDAKPTDKANKKNIERRLQDLKERRIRLKNGGA